MNSHSNQTPQPIPAPALPPHRPPNPAPRSTEGPAAPSAMRVGRFVGIGVCAVAFGLLIWAKLQLVAGVPRTAIADPKPMLPPATTTDASSPSP